MKRVLSVIMLAVLSLPSLSLAIPQLINFQGVLTSSGGTPAAGSKSMTFALYTATSGGTPLWSETRSVSLSNGVYSVALGSVTPLPASVFAGNSLFLGVAVDGDAELTPRQRITSVGYTFRAESADSVAPGGVATGSIADGAVTDEKISAVSAAKLVGKLPGSALPANVVLLGDSGKLPSGILPPEAATQTMLAAYIQAPLRADNSSTPPASPAAGQLYFDTTTKALMYYDGTAWAGLGATRRLFYTSGYSLGDGTDSGFVAGRSLAFTKLRSDSRLRITYSDNLRVISTNACQWEIYLDGSPLSTPLVMALYNSDTGYSHRQSTLVGYAPGVTAGAHQIQVKVSSVPGFSSGADCYTGWQSTYLLEAEELP